MQEKKIRQIIEQVNTGEEIPNEKVEEIISAVKNENETQNYEDQNKKLEIQLREQLNKEYDWKERLRIMARIISLGLE